MAFQWGQNGLPREHGDVICLFLYKGSLSLGWTDPVFYATRLTRLACTYNAEFIFLFIFPCFLLLPCSFSLYLSSTDDAKKKP